MWHIEILRRLNMKGVCITYFSVAVMMKATSDKRHNFSLWLQRVHAAEVSMAVVTGLGEAEGTKKLTS